MLGWIQLTLRDIKRRVEVDMVQSNKFEESMDVLSVGYHGCCKIVSQPLPFAYEQLTLTLALALALTLTLIPALTLTRYEQLIAMLTQLYISPTSPLHLPYISLHLPYISHTSPLYLPGTSS